VLVTVCHRTPMPRDFGSRLADDRAVDAFTLMLFSGAYTNEREIIEKMCSYDLYIGRVDARLSSGDLHETVNVAMEKAKGGGW
jgi:hypothetical protein